VGGYCERKKIRKKESRLLLLARREAKAKERTGLGRGTSKLNRRRKGTKIRIASGRIFGADLSECLISAAAEKKRSGERQALPFKTLDCNREPVCSRSCI